MDGFVTFIWKEACFRICSSHVDAAKAEIVAQRAELDRYFVRHPSVRTALEPVPLTDDAPEILRRMHRASVLTGVGPMAAVAGCFAQVAVEAACRAGAEEALVENGGDIYLQASRDLTVGLYAGERSPVRGLAFQVAADRLPLALCSSSSRMGHSSSFGDCDLATVLSGDGALADAAATLACNLVRDVADLDKALDRVAGIPGVTGALLVKAGRVGLKGDLPKLVRQQDAAFASKITRHPGSAGGV